LAYPHAFIEALPEIEDSIVMHRGRKENFVGVGKAKSEGV
jgi:hypothetical protein